MMVKVCSSEEFCVARWHVKDLKWAVLEHFLTSHQGCVGRGAVHPVDLEHVAHITQSEYRAELKISGGVLEMWP